MPAAPRWIRRLFGQRIQQRHTTGADLGFTGAAANLVITDDHRASAIREAFTPDRRLIESYGYLRKVLKNGTIAARQRDDRELLDALDEAREAAAEASVVIAERLKHFIGERGYGDEFEPRPSVDAMVLPVFEWPAVDGNGGSEPPP